MNKMNCQQMEELLPDYLQGALPAAQVAEVEQHCEHCAGCAQDIVMWKKLALLPQETPSVESRQRFDAMMHAYSTTVAETAASVRAAANSAQQPTVAKPSWNFLEWLRTPFAAVAWSAALLLIGLYAGTHISNRTTPAPSDELASLHAEVTSMRQLVALSMLQQQSASERLQGVSWSNREDHLDPQVQSALMRTLRSDGSVDVRLAALDALSRHAAQPLVRKNVLDALQEQQSPLVQVAMIDQLTEWRDPGAAQRLRLLEQTPNLNPAVKQRAEWAIAKLQESTQ
ncbi:MAG TPA: zf-HC2 domain-containing protein [Candidatus Eremiobacteraceae bacterium]|jgi:anti-sigma factor RsiW|nr:zf-HC2 domain-containing protein [Candidatus Eremiobacteraceae bacterium]